MKDAFYEEKMKRTVCIKDLMLLWISWLISAIVVGLIFSMFWELLTVNLALIANTALIYFLFGKKVVEN
jgi:hypothetical protein